jgi:hypothetical protein
MPTQQRQIEVLTNHLAFGATTLAAIYRERWQIEFFFKPPWRAPPNRSLGRLLWPVVQDHQLLAAQRQLGVGPPLVIGELDLENLRSQHLDDRADLAT